MFDQQELFPNQPPSLPPSAADRRHVFDADTRWLFESETGVDLEQYVDAALFRLGWSSKASKRDAHAKQLQDELLRAFVENPNFAAQIAANKEDCRPIIAAELRRLHKILSS